MPLSPPGTEMEKLSSRLSSLRVSQGPSGEMRRFVAGIRAVTAAMTLILILARHDVPPLGNLAFALLLTYCVWSALILWREARDGATTSLIWLYWVDVAWSCIMLKLLKFGTMMMVLTLVNPIVVVTIGYGVGQGLLLAGLAALGIAADRSNYLMRDIAAGWGEGIPAVLTLVLVPMAALLARPMSVLRKRIALLGDMGDQLDTRRGLEPTCEELVRLLREGTEAEIVALVLPSNQAAPAMLSTREDGSFRAKHEAHSRFEAMLAQLQDGPASFVRRSWWDPRRSVTRHAKGPLAPETAARLDALAALLEVRSLHVVPLTRDSHAHGHFVVAYRTTRANRHDVSALAGAAPEFLRIIEQATLVDQLQEESAGHERARIGRDLHDSAIQPYLGLKYAVESVALRIAKDNPARVELDSLAELVNGEVSALRELISGLRTGSEQGDNALVPAVRRQMKRFALLFGIEVEIDCPDTLPTTRAIASALFHMVNEALNNIRKHTDARRVWVSLSIDDAKFRLVVRDDAGTLRGRPVDGFHPVSLSERAAEMNGTLILSLPDGLNHQLTIEIPLE